MCRFLTSVILVILLEELLTMTSKLGAADTNCVSCGIAELDDVKLKECDGCDLVRYCSDNCQEDHRSQHEEKCKERAAELRDEILFKQPESTHMGDCPICCLPLPIEDEKVVSYPCCSKFICKGCTFAEASRQRGQNRQHFSCPFCRQSTSEPANTKLMKRVAANDPAALWQMGLSHADREEFDKAFHYYTRAAELGDVEAHYHLSTMYKRGQYVERDEKKEWYHLEEAAIRGHAYARHNLGCHEERNGEMGRAVKHWIINANLGDDWSIQTLKNCYKDGLVSKEEFAAALRGHHAAVKAMKSPQREAAEKAGFYS